MANKAAKPPKKQQKTFKNFVDSCGAIYEVEFLDGLASSAKCLYSPTNTKGSEAFGFTNDQLSHLLKFDSWKEKKD